MQLQKLISQPINILATDIFGEIRSNIEGINPWKDGNTNIYDLIFRIFEFTYTFAGIVLVAYIIYGGFLYITAGGNEEKIKQGQKAVTSAIIGFVLVLAAAIILRTIKTVLKVE
ncbi:pilin [Patescibacteria group bacterium]|nr:pilin [Patescibacteria group bacterium]